MRRSWQGPRAPPSERALVRRKAPAPAPAPAPAQQSAALAYLCAVQEATTPQQYAAFRATLAEMRGSGGGGSAAAALTAATVPRFVAAVVAALGVGAAELLRGFADFFPANLQPLAAREIQRLLDAAAAPPPARAVPPPAARRGAPGAGVSPSAGVSALAAAATHTRATLPAFAPPPPPAAAGGKRSAAAAGFVP